MFCFQGGEDESTASIYFTLKNPPKLLEVPPSEELEAGVGKRVSYFSELAQTHDSVFGHCLTYQVEIPNPKKQTEKHAFTPSITRCLDMMEKMDKAVYYTAMSPVKYPSQQLPGIDDGIDQLLCRHYKDKEVRAIIVNFDCLTVYMHSISILSWVEDCYIG